ncbi:hypothetical protein BDZ89DRAFT_1040579 [Hymenopellis radicata]|nr:hypothetical protein BDZ89DRAFT_1040579 [Hymenopellis radicata]
MAPLSGPSTTSPTPVEKENVPPTTSPAHIPIKTPSETSSAAAAPSSTPPLMEPSVPCPPEEAIQAVSRSTIDESASDDPTSLRRISSHEQSAQTFAPLAKETPKPPRPALSSISNILPDVTRPGAVVPSSPAASSALKRPLVPSTSPIALSLQSNKRQKQSYVADPDDSNPTTDIIVTGAATKEVEHPRSDESQNDALHDKPAHTTLAEASHDQQSVPMLKDIGDPVAAKRRFLYERMNIFDITSEWEPTPPQARRLERRRVKDAWNIWRDGHTISRMYITGTNVDSSSYEYAAYARPWKGLYLIALCEKLSGRCFGHPDISAPIDIRRTASPYLYIESMTS